MGGYNPLHSAAESGQTEAVQALLDFGADLEARSYYGGKTPLHLAAQSGHLEVVQALFTNGANLDALDKDNKTPLDHALASGIKKQELIAFEVSCHTPLYPVLADLVAGYIDRRSS